MVVLITWVLLCAPLLTRAPCAPHQAGKGGNTQINSLSIPQWGPRDVLVCRRPRRCDRSEKWSPHLEGEKADSPNIKKKRRFGKALLPQRRTSAAFNSNSGQRKHKHSKASPDAATQEGFCTSKAATLLSARERGCILIKAPIFGEDIGTLWGNSYIQVLWFDSRSAFSAFESPCSLQVGEGL